MIWFIIALWAYVMFGYAYAVSHEVRRIRRGEYLPSVFVRFDVIFWPLAVMIELEGYFHPTEVAKRITARRPHIPTQLTFIPHPQPPKEPVELTQQGTPPYVWSCGGHPTLCDCKGCSFCRKTSSMTPQEFVVENVDD